MTNYTWSHTFDFTIDDGGFVSPNWDRGIWQPGVGWTNWGGIHSIANIYNDFINKVNITNVIAEYNVTNSGDRRTHWGLRTAFADEGGISEDFSIPYPGIVINGPGIAAHSFNGNPVGIVSFLIACEVSSVNWAVVIPKITVAGIGANPFLTLKHTGPSDCPFYHATIGDEESV